MPEKTTPIRALPFPTSAGEVKLGAVDIEELATKLDETMLGLTSGETYAATKVVTKAEAEAGIEPSATRPAFVILTVDKLKGLTVGGVAIGTTETTGRISIIVPPGQKWKATVAVEQSTLLL